MNDLTKLIFEKLGVEPNEEFMIAHYLDTFILSDDLQIFVKDNIIRGNYVKWKVFNIESLITGKEQIIKIPKPLLTEEEREWLKFWKFKKVKKGATHLVLTRLIGGEEKSLYIHIESNFKSNFSGLESGKEYTPEDLGL